MPKVKHGRENDGARHQRHEGVEHTDAHGFAGQGVLVAHVASEDLHGGDAEAQGKERLIHGRRDRRAESVFPDPIERRHQIERIPSAAPGSVRL